MQKACMVYKIPSSRDEAIAQDMRDPIARAADAFALPDGVIYLDGHSLGPGSRSALEAVERAAKEEWSNGLIKSWNEADWINLPRTVAAKIARLIGAPAESVLVCDSVSVNLYKLAAAALDKVSAKRILVDGDEFPTDQYIAQGLRDQTGAMFVREEGPDLKDALAQGGVLIKSVVNYRTAAVENIAEFERIAADAGSLIVWDLSHATGCVDMDLPRDGVKLATGCTYKYLNGGPGAPAYVYVDPALANDLRNPLPGWFGHADPFAFDPDYRPVQGVARFATGTPCILSLRALDGALDMFENVSVEMLGAKARALGDLCLSRAERLDLKTISPGIGQTRGGHVSLLHADGYAIVQALIARNIIPDFRAPDAMRFGFSPLQVRFVDVWDAMLALQDILQTEVWKQPQYSVRSTVT